MKKILVIDDSYFFRVNTARILADAGYMAISAETGKSGLSLVRSEKPDLVLLDLILPDIDGFSICRILRESESNHLMPIIMLTSKSEMEDVVVGLELGADDYITKPFNPRELLARIRNTLLRIERNRSASPLTGLPGNLEIRREIESRLERRVPFSVIYADIDDFKAFNDVYGFARGDQFIKLTADVIAEAAALYGRPNDFFGHIGGDDFVLVTAPDSAEAICRCAVRNFDARAGELYDPEDVRRGGIVSINRRGEVEHFPITGISMAVVTSGPVIPDDFSGISERASALKKRLKTEPGSIYAVYGRA